MATIDETLASVKAGEITAADALKQEQAEPSPRSTLIKELEALMAAAGSDPVSPAGVGIDTDTKNNATVMEASQGEFQYELVKVKVSKKVLDNTGGLGAFYDPESKQTIGKEAVSVPATPQVEGWLRTQELVRG